MGKGSEVRSYEPSRLAEHGRAAKVCAVFIYHFSRLDFGSMGGRGPGEVSKDFRFGS